MDPKNLLERREQLITLATELFDYIIKQPAEKRLDYKERTGIQIYLREVGTRNSLFSPIRLPEELAQVLAVEKAVRSETLGDFSSQNSEDPEAMRFRGSLSLLFHHSIIQGSTSGVLGDEDTAVSLRLLSCWTQIPAEYVIKHVIDNGGMLPECFFDRDHYLYGIVH
jgi:hypothetical protein